jgi:predicted transglutaminase-like cysteine proteinase
MSRETPTKSTIRPRRDFWVILACLGLLLSLFWFFNPHRASAHSTSRTAFPAANHVSLASMIEDRTHVPAAPQPGGTGQPTLLLGVDTEPVADGDLLEKWRRVKADVGRDLESVARCHANGPCTAAAQALIAIISEGVGHRGRARVGMINRAVDLAITPMSDQAQWGISDRWSAPLETLQSSRGDCENAALAVHVDDQWLILDNRTLTLVSDTDDTRAIPEYVLDQNASADLFGRALPPADIADLPMMSRSSFALACTTVLVRGRSSVRGPVARQASDQLADAHQGIVFRLLSFSEAYLCAIEEESSGALRYLQTLPL